MHNFQSGDAVLIRCNGCDWAGEVLLTSANGRALMLGFDGMIDGHLGLLPLLADEDDVWRALSTQTPIALTPQH